MGEFVAFDRKDGRGGHLGSAENPVVTVTKAGVYFGADVWRDVLGEAEYVEYLTDAEDLRVGFRIVDEDDVQASSYSITEYQARAAPVWDQLGMDVDEATHVPLDTDSEEFPVIDVSEFVGSDDGGASASEPDRDRDEFGESEADEENEGNESEPLAGLGELSDVQGVGEKTLANIAEHHGFETVADIANATVSDLKEVPGVGRAAASRLTDNAVDITESEQNGTGDTVLDIERVETALGSVGVPTAVSATEFIDAIDDNKQTFGAARDLDIARGDVADLVMRLDLEEELKAGGGRAAERFEEGSA